MKNLLKKTTHIVMAFVMVLAVTACGAQPKDSPVEKSSEPVGLQENSMPIANGDVTLTILCGIDGVARQSMKDLNDHSVVQEIARETGLKFNFMHPPEGDDGTYFNTTIASGEFPDLFYTDRFTLNYPGGAEGAMQDNILINLDELISQYAPNFLDLIEERRSRITELGGNIDSWIQGDGGAVVKFGTMFLPPFVDARVHNGLVVRKDLLEELNLDAPVTVDDYTNVLQAFKDSGIEVPLALPRFTENASYTNVNLIASAFGVSINDFQLDDSAKVNYSRTMPEYKEYLQLLNEWASKGFIDRDFISRTGEDTNKLFYNGRSAMCFWQSATTRQALAIGPLEDEDFDVLGLVFPRKTADQEIHLTRQALSVNNNAWYVSATCKNPVEAVRFVDYLHIEDTRLLTAWGLGNEEYPTYDIEPDGTRVFSEFMQNNPDMDLRSSRAMYTLGTFQVMYDDMMERSQYNLPQNAQIWEAWATNSDNRLKMPHVMSMTIEESKEFTSIKSKMDNYADEMIYKFIFGEESLDGFDAFVEQLISLGAPRAIEINQQAYDRFISR